MAEPTVTVYGPSSFATGSVNHDIATVSWSAGDELVALGMTEDQGITLAAPTVVSGTGTGLTFSAITNSPTTTASSCKGYGWRAVAAGSGSGTLRVVISNTSNAGGFFVMRAAAGTFGTVSALTVLTNTAKTLSVTRGGANSVIGFLAGDYSANTDVTVDPSPAGGTQRAATLISGAATFFGFTWPDQGAAGTTSYGIANASGTGTLTKIAVEIPGASGTDGSATSPAADAIGDLVDPVMSAGSTAETPTADATGTLPAAAIAASSDVTAPAADSTGSFPQPSLSAGATVTSPTLDATGTLPAPSVSGGTGWENITDADASTYVPTSEDVDAVLRCVVTATNAIGSTDAASNETDPVADTADGTVVTPVADATGSLPAPTVTAGAAVTAPTADATGDLPSPAVTNGDWEDISGATSSTYLLDPADEAALVRCVVVASNAIGDSAPEASNEVGPVEPAEEPVNAEVIAPPATGTGDIPTPSLPVSMEITSGQLSATGSLPVPAVTGSSGQTVTTPAADGTGGFPAPTVTAGATATTPAADGTGDLAAPTVTAGGETVSPTLDATGALPAPTVTGTAAGEVAAPPLDGAGSVPVPAVSAGADVTAPAMDGTGDLPDPAVTGDGAATVNIPPLDASGAFPAPIVVRRSPNVPGGVNPRRRRREGQVSRGVADDRPLVLRR